MRLTEEQKAVIDSSGNLKIHAVAGSGKTSTLIEYARHQGKGRRVLYLAFNRSVKIDSQKRFAQEKLGHVQVETAHSLAWGRIVPSHGYAVRASYKPYEIADILKIKPSRKDPVTTISICGHIGKLVSLFCNQAESKVADLDYPSFIAEPRSRGFVRKHQDRIIDGARKLLAKMNSAQIAVTHEFYLKKYQLLKPRLNCDIVLFDEGQDASPVMLDIFLNQESARKIIVGDIHQQIYSWRYAINALKSVAFRDYSLTTSFRFPQEIADTAMEVLRWKKYLKNPQDVTIKGKGGPLKRASSKAVLARTNLSLVRRAIEFINSSRKKRKIYFEGNLNSYLFAAEGASLWDVLNLYQGKNNLIRDPLIKKMRSIDELKEYADLSGDSELLTLIEMVNEYGRKLPVHINRLKDLHVADEDRSKADMIFSTVHRCKGLEYDSVSLENDFITEKKLRRVEENKDTPLFELERLNEEINLLYVAITRSRGILRIPEGLFLEKGGMGIEAQDFRTVTRRSSRHKVL
ncbi:MAG: UvrD-helicase domain-containing protein, partial [Chitinispirillaceae bacterium]